MKTLVAIWLSANLVFAQGIGARVTGRLGIPTAGGGGSISYTGKSCTANNPSGSSVTCTWAGGNPAAGENVYCDVAEFNGGVVFTGVTDSASNTYSTNGSVFNGGQNSGFAQYQHFYFANLPGTITTTTFNLASPGFYASLLCVSVTGGSGTPVDGTCTPNTSTGTSSSTTVAITAASTFVYGTISINPTDTITTPGSGYTFVNTTLGANFQQQYQIFSSSGSKSFGATYNTSTLADLTCAAYK